MTGLLITRMRVSNRHFDFKTFSRLLTLWKSCEMRPQVNVLCFPMQSAFSLLESVPGTTHNTLFFMLPTCPRFPDDPRSSASPPGSLRTAFLTLNCWYLSPGAGSLGNQLHVNLLGPHLAHLLLPCDQITNTVDAMPFAPHHVVCPGYRSS